MRYIVKEIKKETLSEKGKAGNYVMLNKGKNEIVFYL